MNLQVDALSYQSPIRTIPALYKIVLTFLIGIITYLSHVEVQFIVFSGTFIFLVAIAKIPIMFLIRWLLVPSFFLIVSMPAFLIGVSNVSEVNNDFIFLMLALGDWQIYLSKSGIQLAYSIIFRAMSLYICMFALLVTTPFYEILKALHKIRVPQVLLDLLVSMYRFIFILWQYASELNLVIKSRQGNVTWKRTLYSVGLVVVQLFVKTFEKYKRMTLVIESRGFNDHLFYGDGQADSVPKTFIGFGVLILLCLFALEWWCRYS